MRADHHSIAACAATALRYCPPASMSALALQLAPQSPLTRPKTRVGGLAEAGTARIGARGSSSRGAHWEKRGGVRQRASDLSVFENWNRYFDGQTGGALQPEPMLQKPGFVSQMAKHGVNFPAYSYALNNPITNSDPDGRWPWEWRNSKRVAYWGFAGGASIGGSACTCYYRVDDKSKGAFNDTCSSVSVTTLSHASHGEGDKCPFAKPAGKSCRDWCQDEAKAAWAAHGSLAAPSTCDPPSPYSRENILLDVE